MEMGVVDFHSFLTLQLGEEHQTPATFALGKQFPVPHEQGVGGCLGHRFSADDDKIIILRSTCFEILHRCKAVNYQGVLREISFTNIFTHVCSTGYMI